MGEWTRRVTGKLEIDRNQTSQQEVQKVENNGALPQTSGKNEFQWELKTQSSIK